MNTVRCDEVRGHFPICRLFCGSHSSGHPESPRGRALAGERAAPPPRGLEPGPPPPSPPAPSPDRRPPPHTRSAAELRAAGEEAGGRGPDRGGDGGAPAQGQGRGQQPRVDRLPAGPGQHGAGPHHRQGHLRPPPLVREAQPRAHRPALRGHRARLGRVHHRGQDLLRPRGAGDRPGRVPRPPTATPRPRPPDRGPPTPASRPRPPTSRGRSSPTWICSTR